MKKLKGWTLYSQEDFDDYDDDDRICHNAQRKECVKDDSCHMVCGTGGGYVNKNHITNPDSRQRAVGKINMLGCRRVELKKGKLIELDGPVDHDMRIVGKVMKESHEACHCHGNAKERSPGCVGCSILELLKIWVESKFNSYEHAMKSLDITEKELGIQK